MKGQETTQEKDGGSTEEMILGTEDTMATEAKQEEISRVITGETSEVPREETMMTTTGAGQDFAAGM